MRFDIEPEEEAGPQLRALGIGPRDVKLVALTHLHIDHDAGLAAFPHSRTLVSPGEMRAASGLAGQIRGYLPQRWPASFDPEPLVFAAEPYGPFARSRRLTADGAVVAVPTPGHTPDHVSIVVEDGEAAVRDRRRRVLQRSEPDRGTPRRDQSRRGRRAGHACPG